MGFEIYIKVSLGSSRPEKTHTQTHVLQDNADQISPSSDRYKPILVVSPGRVSVCCCVCMYFFGQPHNVVWSGRARARISRAARMHMHEGWRPHQNNALRPCACLCVGQALRGRILSCVTQDDAHDDDGDAHGHTHETKSDTAAPNLKTGSRP